jgi:exonuclease SbcD
MLKICTFGDIHLGSYQGKILEGGINSRFIDFVKTFNETIDYTVKNCNICLITGDIFKNKDPQPIELEEFAKGLKKLSVAGIETVITLGNHDLFLSEKLKYSFSVLNILELSNVYISTKPEIINLKDIQIQSMPYPVRNLLGLKDMEEVQKYCINKINEIYETRDKNKPIMFSGHFTIQDAVTGSEQMSVNRFAEPVVPKSVFLDKEYLYVALGHLHRHQIICEKPHIVYSGSNNRIDFNEAEEPKGFILINIDKNKLKWEFIEVDARKFLDLSYDIKDDINVQEFIENDLLKKKKQLKNAIVKVSILMPKKNKLTFNPKSIIQKLEEYEVDYIQGSCIPKTYDGLSSKNDSKFNESMSILDALKLYSDSNGIKDKERFIKFGEEIIKKSFGGK